MMTVGRRATFLRCRRLAGGSAAGFTLIELLVVMSLLVLLATIGIMAHQSSVKRGREAVLKQNLFHLREAIDQHHADKGKYPTTLQDLVTAGYLRRVPEDPLTGSTDTWQTIMSEPDPSDPSVEPGIYDVKSGAEGVALDGTAYSQW